MGFSNIFKIFGNHCNQDFLIFPSWSRYLTFKADAHPDCIVDFETGDVWLIVLAVLEMLMRLVGVGAVAMIIYAGFRMITSAGNPETISTARSTILNAVVGLVIAISASAIVSFIAGSFSDGGNQTAGIPEIEANGNLITDTVLPFVFVTLGALSVLFIIIGAFRYVLSSGDPKNTEAAKETIIYALVGLIVAVLAYTIVNFVIGAL